MMNEIHFNRVDAGFLRDGTYSQERRYDEKTDVTAVEIYPRWIICFFPPSSSSSSMRIIR